MTKAICECPSLKDEDVVPMGLDGLDERVFATVEEVARRDDDLWWLWLGKCRACAQAWLITSEERIYDDHIFLRVTPEAAQAVTDGVWPSQFVTYEAVLQAASRHSRPGRFADDMSGALVATAHDLRRARPEITLSEVAALIGVEAEHVPALLAVKTSSHKAEL